MRLQGYYLTHKRESKWVHAFLKGISPKVNVIARLESEHAYLNGKAWRLKEYGVLFHYHYFLVYGLVVAVRVPSMDLIEMFHHLPRIIIITSYLEPQSCVQIVRIR